MPLLEPKAEATTTRLACGVVFPAKGPWDLPIRGYEVLQITFAYPVDLVTYGDAGASAFVRLEGEFDFVDGGRRRSSLDAGGERWEDLVPLLKLRHDRITAAHATEAGYLAVEFASGSRIEAGPSEMCENWQVSGPGFQLIGLPSGGVAVFRDDPSIDPEARVGSASRTATRHQARADKR